MSIDPQLVKEKLYEIFQPYNKEQEAKGGLGRFEVRQDGSYFVINNLDRIFEDVSKNTGIRFEIEYTDTMIILRVPLSEMVEVIKQKTGADVTKVMKEVRLEHNALGTALAIKLNI